jgi:hypothetical protein
MVTNLRIKLKLPNTNEKKERQQHGFGEIGAFVLYLNFGNSIEIWY